MELVQSCVKHLFSYFFTNMLDHMSKKAVVGRTVDLSFTDPPPSAHNVLFN